ncbi:MAG: outer membrane lipoprotein carrier protein LolA [Bacteroidota bacterium]
MMKKRIFTCLCVVLALSLTSDKLFSQDAKAEEVLKKVSDKARTYESLEASFSSTLEDKAIDLTATQNGSILLSGEKFKLNIDEKYLVISDSKTLWNYGMDTGECMIENVSDIMEDQGIQPSEIFTIWENDFKKYYDSESSVGGKNCDVIKLVPVNPKDKPFHTIKVFIDQSNLELVQAIIYGKEGNNTTYTIETFKPNVSVSSGDFVFNKADYPGVEMIDNR